MPPLEEGPTTPLQWCVLAGLVLGLVGALIAAPMLRWVAAVIVLVAIVSGRVHFWRLRQLARTRDDDIGTFARALDFRNTDPWLIRAVYEEVNGCLPKTLRPFPLRTTDTCETLGIDPEDLQDIGEVAAQRAGYSLEKLEENPYYGSVRTIGELIKCLQAQPRILEGGPSRLAAG